MDITDGEALRSRTPFTIGKDFLGMEISGFRQVYLPARFARPPMLFFAVFAACLTVRAAFMKTFWE